jgi:hypothetical protein
MNDTDFTQAEREMFSRYADEAERGYDLEELRRRGRPRLGPAAYSVVLPIRVTQDMADALDVHARRLNQGRSEAVRQILEQALADHAA